METLYILGIFLSITALASLLNHRLFKLPQSVGLTLISLFFSLILILFSRYKNNFYFDSTYLDPIVQVDLNKTLMMGMIGFLLFAGGMQLKLTDVIRQKWPIIILSSLGVIGSALITGLILYPIAQLIGIEIDLLHCLIFGALISPTDPIAVLSVFKEMDHQNIEVPRDIKTIIAGESMFNDGFGLFLFTLLTKLAIAMPTDTFHYDPQITPTMGHLIKELCIILGGGILLGIFLGILITRLIQKVDDFPVRVLVSLAVVTNGYVLATMLDLSGPLSIVIAGLMTGAFINGGKCLGKTTEQLKEFWFLVDEVLNGILFVLIGLSVFRMEFTRDAISLAICAIPIVLFARWLSVGIPMILIKRTVKRVKCTINLLTWSGIRGGISIALALSLAMGPMKNQILVATYAVVVFSIIVQGLTISPVLKRFLKNLH